MGPGLSRPGQDRRRQARRRLGPATTSATPCSCRGRPTRRSPPTARPFAESPDNAWARYDLGNALREQGKLDEAIAAYREAIRLNPDDPFANITLSWALRSEERFAESLAAMKRGHELGIKQSGWRYDSAEWVRQAESFVAFESKLPAFLKGEWPPKDNRERFDWPSSSMQRS